MWQRWYSSAEEFLQGTNDDYTGFLIANQNVKVYDTVHTAISENGSFTANPGEVIYIYRANPTPEVNDYRAVYAFYGEIITKTVTRIEKMWLNIEIADTDTTLMAVSAKEYYTSLYTAGSTSQDASVKSDDLQWICFNDRSFTTYTECNDGDTIDRDTKDKTYAVRYTVTAPEGYKFDVDNPPQLTPSNSSLLLLDITENNLTLARLLSSNNTSLAKIRINSQVDLSLTAGGTFPDPQFQETQYTSYTNIKAYINPFEYGEETKYITNYEKLGWFTDAECTQPVTGDTTISAGDTYYYLLSITAPEGYKFGNYRANSYDTPPTAEWDFGVKPNETWSINADDLVKAEGLSAYTIRLICTCKVPEPPTSITKIDISTSPDLDNIQVGDQFERFITTSLTCYSGEEGSYTQLDSQCCYRNFEGWDIMPIPTNFEEAVYPYFILLQTGNVTDYTTGTTTYYIFDENVKVPDGWEIEPTTNGIKLIKTLDFSASAAKKAANNIAAALDAYTPTNAITKADIQKLVDDNKGDCTTEITEYSLTRATKDAEGKVVVKVKVTDDKGNEEIVSKELVIDKLDKSEAEIAADAIDTALDGLVPTNKTVEQDVLDIANQKKGDTITKIEVTKFELTPATEETDGKLDVIVKVTDIDGNTAEKIS